MIQKVLQDIWFSDREAKIYLAWLETWLAPASKIAKYANERRVTTYQTLLQMSKKQWVKQVVKNNVSQYEMVSPKELWTIYTKRVWLLNEKIPEMVALMNNFSSKPIVKYYQWREQLKELFNKIVFDWFKMNQDDYFLSFLWTWDVDKEFSNRLSTEFKRYRLTCPTRSRFLLSEWDHEYLKYNMKHHEFRLVKDPIFKIANQIVIYGDLKVAILMYNADELSWVVIQSQSFHDALKWIFYTIWNVL